MSDSDPGWSPGAASTDDADATTVLRRADQPRVDVHPDYRTYYDAYGTDPYGVGPASGGASGYDDPDTTVLTLRARPRSPRRSPARNLSVVAAAVGVGLVATVAAGLGLGAVSGSDDDPQAVETSPTAGATDGPVAVGPVTMTTGPDGVVGPALPPKTGKAATSGPAGASSGPAAGNGGGGPVTVTDTKLTWAPPKLTNPETITVAKGKTSLKLDDGKDYRVVLPKTRTDLGGGITITGGHNVVIIGGEVYIANSVTDAKKARGFYLKDQTGTIHIEGVHITGHTSDGFNFDQRKGSTIQLQNILVDRVYGSKDGHHADLVQTWAGPARLRMDGFRGTTEYQGFFLLPTQHWSGGTPKEFAFRRTYITMVPGSAYSLWLPEDDPSWFDVSGLTVKLDPGKGGDRLSWPNSSLGVRVLGENEAMDLPGGTPGGGYVSPGYRS